MKKNTKRILTLVMAVLMLMALCTAAFADNTVTVYVRLQTATAPTNWDFSLGTLTNVSYLTGTAQSDYFIPVTVTKSGNIYVKDVVNTLLGNNLVSCSNCGTYGCVHDADDACICSTCNCTWKRVANTYQVETYGSYASVLNSITYNNNLPKTNNSTIIPLGDGHGHYEGTSWEYFVANSSSATAVYPQNLYMDQYEVNSSLYITISFDTSSFDW